MTIQIKTPALGESIAEASVAKWLVAEGDFVTADQLVAELETDKVNLEVTAPQAGKLVKIIAAKGAKVKVRQPMADIDTDAKGAPAPKAEAKPEAAKPVAAAPVVQVAAPSEALGKSGPAVKKLAAESGKDTSGIQGTGKGGRLTKADVLGVATASAKSEPKANRTERVEMSRIRKTIASRLKQAQNTAAMLTTYNEVDMSAVMSLRAKYKDGFEKKHGTKLGFMGFFTRAVVEALQQFPALNAEIDGDDIVYKNHYDIGIAVSSDKGLVVPVVRGADALTIAGIEGAIADLGTKAKTGGLKPDDLVGATFSITNGGIFGSMMSMPILNYPQVGILGMHAIKERPVVVSGQIVIRPMMYVALTYDHRIVDGKEAVSFLVAVKDFLEEPGKVLLGL
ncbi:MAG TPA: 2-oxoglutarate dehydrogenase complex dihydrolipoyllysine-residue succinyltransferase [Alphaproteobacteria bacterium]|nr:2-oxoglutarate dehydrogenase complex dihydrolipoyllysine-residue succinyltransferase [Alphaproteobacteria bacterium]